MADENYVLALGPRRRGASLRRPATITPIEKQAGVEGISSEGVGTKLQYLGVVVAWGGGGGGE